MASCVSQGCYEPSGRMRRSSMPIILGYGLAAALVVGVIGGIITFYIDLVFVTSICFGYFIGKAIIKGAIKGHCRNQGLIVTCAVLLGTFVFFIKLFTHYHLDRQVAIEKLIVATRSQYQVDERKVDLRREATKYLDKLVIDRSGIDGFFGWLNMKLESGMEIRPTIGSLNLGPDASAYWLLIEMTVVILIASFVSSTVCSQPYCERCKCWLLAPTWTLRTDKLTARKVLKELRGEEGLLNEGMLSLMPERDICSEHAKLSLHQCSSCEQGYLTMLEVSPGQVNGRYEESTIVRNLHLPADLVKRVLGDEEAE